VRSACSCPGFNFSAKFRRNFGFFSVSASYRDPKFRYFSIYFVSKFKIQQISSKIHRNSPKFTEIPERNSVSADHRDSTEKRNGEPCSCLAFLGNAVSRGIRLVSGEAFPMWVFSVARCAVRYRSAVHSEFARTLPTAMLE